MQFMADENTIKEALKSVKYPGFSRDIVSFGLVQEVAVDGGTARVNLSLTTGNAKIPTEIKQAVEETLSKVQGIEAVECNIAVQAPKGATTAASGQQSAVKLPGIRRIIAVASGKGGVGKSTVATNLACAISQELAENGSGGSVGLLDCDIYGPSIPQMMGLHVRPEIENEKIVPPENFGIKVMSMALLVDADAPVVWRGPMINNAISQFAQHVNWGEIDTLVVDLPPGTGDAQLSLVQTFPVDAALIVTTPQKVAVDVTRRGARMFEKVSVPIIGICENMSYLEAPDGTRQHIFGEGGGLITSKDLDAPLLAQIPLDSDVREGGDRGLPITISYPDSTAAKAFREMARSVLVRLESNNPMG